MKSWIGAFLAKVIFIVIPLDKVQKIATVLSEQCLNDFKFVAKKNK